MLILFAGAVHAAPILEHIHDVDGIFQADAQLLGHIVGVHGAMFVSVCQRALDMRILLARFHTAHLGVAAQRHCRHAKLCAFARETYIGARQTQHEFRHAHAKCARRQIMPTLMDEHENAQHDNDEHNHEDNVHRTPFFVFSWLYTKET